MDIMYLQACSLSGGKKNNNTRNKPEMPYPNMQLLLNGILLEGYQGGPAPVEVSDRVSIAPH